MAIDTIGELKKALEHYDESLTLTVALTVPLSEEDQEELGVKEAIEPFNLIDVSSNQMYEECDDGSQRAVVTLEIAPNVCDLEKICDERSECEQ